VSSTSGSLTRNSDPNNPHRSTFGTYSTSKAELNAVTLAFAAELESSGIKVNAACPGFTATDLNNFQGTRTVEQGAREAVRLAPRVLDDDVGLLVCRSAQTDEQARERGADPLDVARADGFTDKCVEIDGTRGQAIEDVPAFRGQSHDRGAHMTFVGSQLCQIVCAQGVYQALHVLPCDSEPVGNPRHRPGAFRDHVQNLPTSLRLAYRAGNGVAAAP